MRFSPAFPQRRFLVPRAWLSLLLLIVLAGCASHSPGPQSSTGIGSIFRPDHDGAPANPPSDLAQTPDPEPQVEPIRRGGPNKPYEVMGHTYEPMTGDVPWKETGLASWYGTKFHGRRTASGELFSMYGLTAAHRTLPIPSYAKVRNLATGKEIIVRVNDRGPFHSSRVMDLSYAAAVKLGITAAGSAMVEIERLTFDDIRTGAWRTPAPTEPESPADPIEALANQTANVPVEAPPEPAPVMPVQDKERAYTAAAQGYWVQLAALSRKDGIDRLQQRVVSDASALVPMMAVFKEAAVYKLQVGPYGTREEAAVAAQQVRDALQLKPMVVERR
ncbi:MAG: septal ring lytic transglycosylase RlpA family protein [Burkholderiales bacterium]|nr:septal ring lytic transglycosylase RlpA family protein [Burkholderiales bacterium]